MSPNLAGEEKIDPRTKRTRALLGQAFRETLEEKGFQALSVQDITEKAGVNRTTFYLHFSDKYALLDYSIGQLFRQELEKRTLHIHIFSPESIRSLIITVAEFIVFSNSRCTSAEPQFEALVERQAKKQVQDLLEAWGQDTAFGPDSKTAAIAGSWAIYGLALAWSHNKKRPGVELFADSISPLIHAILGLGEPAGAG
jgi:AcrR family transcriptional regulator